MSLINVQNLTFAYDGSFKNVFENVSFQLDTNWKLGFVGRNGKGKTTFLNLLLGKYEYAGKITADVNFTYFPFEVSDTDRLVCEVLDEICPNAEYWEIVREFSYLSMSEEKLYCNYGSLSEGEKTKALIAGLFLKHNSFLLIDEPTNHLDNAARDNVANYLRKKKGYILVSHDRAFLDGCVDHILSINKSNIEIQSGNFSSWFDNFQTRQESEVAQNDKLQKDIDRLAASAARASSWADKTEAAKFGNGPVDRGFIGHKAAKMMRRAKSVENRQRKAIEQKSLLLKNVESVDSLKMFPLGYHREKLLEFSDVEIFYGEKKVCGPINLQVLQGERIALEGKNGCGKSSLLKIAAGEEIFTTGRFAPSSGLKISYLSQTSSHLRGNIAKFIEDNKIDGNLFRTVLSKMGFAAEDFVYNVDISSLSQGQKKKIMIAKSLCENAHLYIWDEPLNYLDVFSRIQLEELILQFQPTMLFVEHDNKFMQTVATRVLSL